MGVLVPSLGSSNGTEWFTVPPPPPPPSKCPPAGASCWAPPCASAPTRARLIRCVRSSSRGAPGRCSRRYEPSGAALCAGAASSALSPSPNLEEASRILIRMFRSAPNLEEEASSSAITTAAGGETSRGMLPLKSGWYRRTLAFPDSSAVTSPCAVTCAPERRLRVAVRWRRLRGGGYGKAVTGRRLRGIGKGAGWRRRRGGGEAPS